MYISHAETPWGKYAMNHNFVKIHDVLVVVLTCKKTLFPGFGKSFKKFLICMSERSTGTETPNSISRTPVNLQCIGYSNAQTPAHGLVRTSFTTELSRRPTNLQKVRAEMGLAHQKTVSSPVFKDRATLFSKLNLAKNVPAIYAGVLFCTTNVCSNAYFPN